MKVLEIREGAELSVRSFSPEETLEVGKALGALLRPGDVVCLVGEVGAGKTVFVQGITMGVGLDPGEGARSPTFALVHEYQARHPVYHVDLYRLDDPGELRELGWEEYLYGQGISIVEWAEKAGKFLPQERLIVQFKLLGTRERELLFLASGFHYEKLLLELANSLHGSSFTNRNAGGGDGKII